MFNGDPRNIDQNPLINPLNDARQNLERMRQDVMLLGGNWAQKIDNIISDLDAGIINPDQALVLAREINKKIPLSSND